MDIFHSPSVTFESTTDKTQSIEAERSFFARHDAIATSRIMSSKRLSRMARIDSSSSSREKGGLEKRDSYLSSYVAAMSAYKYITTTLLGGGFSVIPGVANIGEKERARLRDALQVITGRKGFKNELQFRQALEKYILKKPIFFERNIVALRDRAEQQPFRYLTEFREHLDKVGGVEWVSTQLLQQRKEGRDKREVVIKRMAVLHKDLIKATNELKKNTEGRVDLFVAECQKSRAYLDQQWKAFSSQVSDTVPDAFSKYKSDFRWALGSSTISKSKFHDFYILSRFISMYVMAGTILTLRIGPGMSTLKDYPVISSGEKEENHFLDSLSIGLDNVNALEKYMAIYIVEVKEKTKKDTEAAWINSTPNQEDCYAMPMNLDVDLVVSLYVAPS